MKGAKKEASISRKAKIMKRCPNAPSKPKLMNVRRSVETIGVHFVGTRIVAMMTPINEV